MNVDQIIPSVEYYNTDTYNHRDRWISYFHQVRLVRAYAGNGTVLEVGIGNGIVAAVLKKTCRITTVDIASDLNPDHVASVDDLRAVASESADVVLCAEVLEHLPFEKFSKCIEELKRVSKNYVIISLPYWGYTFGFKLRLPIVGVRTVKWKVSNIRRHHFNGQHYWELGKKGYPVSKIKRAITDAKLSLLEDFWDLDDPYHMYFVFKK